MPGLLGWLARGDVHRQELAPLFELRIIDLVASLDVEQIPPFTEDVGDVYVTPEDSSSRLNGGVVGGWNRAGSALAINASESDETSYCQTRAR
jgi:hypothetical protein